MLSNEEKEMNKIINKKWEDKIKAKIEEVENMTLVEIAEKVEGHTYYLSLDGLSEGKKIASYFIQSLLEKEE